MVSTLQGTEVVEELGHGDAKHIEETGLAEDEVGHLAEDGLRHRRRQLEDRIVPLVQTTKQAVAEDGLEVVAHILDDVVTTRVQARRHRRRQVHKRPAKVMQSTAGLLFGQMVRRVGVGGGRWLLETARAYDRRSVEHSPAESALDGTGTAAIDGGGLPIEGLVSHRPRLLLFGVGSAQDPLHKVCGGRITARGELTLIDGQFTATAVVVGRQVHPSCIVASKVAGSVVPAPSPLRCSVRFVLGVRVLILLGPCLLCPSPPWTLPSVVVVVARSNETESGGLGVLQFGEDANGEGGGRVGAIFH